MSSQCSLFGSLGTYIAGSSAKSSPNALKIRQITSASKEKTYSEGSPERLYQEWYWSRYQPDINRWSPPEADSLPCLYSSNGTENDKKWSLNHLSGYHKRQAECIHHNVRYFCEKVGLSNVGFLTLTFSDNVFDQKEAFRRFKSLNAHYLSKRFGDWILVKERQKRGAWHYHILIDCLGDIRDGINFNGLHVRDYSSANGHLRSLWGSLRVAMPKYGFGRSELLPLRSNSEAIGRYVGKYISKHVGVREEQDKGVRLFSTSGGFKAANTRFAWNTPGNWIWRMKLKAYAEFLGITDYDDLKHVLGRKWAEERADEIYHIRLPASTRFPTLRHWQAYMMRSSDEVPAWYCDGMTNFRDPNLNKHVLHYNALKASFEPRRCALAD